MLVILLPTTNIYNLDETAGVGGPILLSQSIYYYLNKIKEKTQDVDYSFFKNIYMINSRVPALSPSYFVFVELIQHFDLLHPTHATVTYYGGGGGGGEDGVGDKNHTPNKMDWGILHAFQRGGATPTHHYVHSVPETPPDVLAGCYIKWNELTPFTYLSETVTSHVTTPVTTHITIMEKFDIDIVNKQFPGSTLIVKVGDCFDDYTIKLIYYLCSIYVKVFITRPTSCWGGESTKYVVCKSFMATKVQTQTPPVQLFNYIKPTHIFLTKMEELNCIFVESQIEVLTMVHNCANKTEKLNALMRTYQQRCIGWFIKHGGNVGVRDV
jgi:hypothetical protein